MEQWRGIMRVVEVVHRDRFGKEIRVERDILNKIHLLGEEYILRVLFAGREVPENYHIGMDSRSSILASDQIGDLEGLEPVTAGYERQSIQSDDFAIVTDSPTSRRANSPSVVFTATSETWEPVSNIFLCVGLGYGSSSVLVSSAALGQSISLSPGESISMRMAMSLSGC